MGVTFEIFILVLMLIVIMLFLVIILMTSFSEIIISNLGYLSKSFFCNTLRILHRDFRRGRRNGSTIAATIVCLSLTLWRRCIFVFRENPAIWKFSVVYENFLAFFHNPGNVCMLVAIQFNDASIDFLFFHLSVKTSVHIVNVLFEQFYLLFAMVRAITIVFVTNFVINSQVIVNRKLNFRLFNSSKKVSKLLP